MMSADFQSIENLLFQLLASVDKTFDPKEKEEVQDFIDVGEYGLALETFVDIVVEENKKILEVDLDLIKKLAVEMSMDQEAFHQKLKEFLV